MNIALILAGGTGSRINSPLPKQYLKVNDKPIIAYTIEAFEKNIDIDSIYLVSSDEYKSHLEDIVKEYGFKKVKEVVIGGKTRQESSFLGLLRVKEENNDKDSIVLIHDAARALISSSIITDNIKACQKYDAVNTAIKVTDTIFYSESNEVVEKSFNRNAMYQSQTPQTFKLDLILSAHKKYQNEVVTDDVQLMIKENKEVHIVEGNELNFKITTNKDLELFQMLVNKNCQDK